MNEQLAQKIEKVTTYTLAIGVVVPISILLLKHLLF